MLGNKLGEYKVTGQRVLDATGRKIEASFSVVGTYVGIDCTMELIGLFLWQPNETHKIVNLFLLT
jgi:hypothetical protein